MNKTFLLENRVFLHIIDGTNTYYIVQVKISSLLFPLSFIWTLKHWFSLWTYILKIILKTDLIKHMKKHILIS